jgi:hypothetical protein
LRLHPNFITHGEAVDIEIDVDARGGTPTGQVALETNHQNPAGDFTLDRNGRVDTDTRLLPGGFSFVTARYGGDPTFAHSDSHSEAVFVAPEPSNTTISLFARDPTTFNTIPFSGGPYGSIVFLRADVAGRSGVGVATGDVNLIDNNHALPGNLFALNSQGNTLTPNSINTFSVGSHTIRANYLGDPSFFPNIAKPVTFLITEAPTKTVLSASVKTAVKATPVTLTATIQTKSFGNPPAGTVTFLQDSTPLGPPVPVGGSNNPSSGEASAKASVTTSQLSVGKDNVTAVYSGDHNYRLSLAAAIAVTVTSK